MATSVTDLQQIQEDLFTRMDNFKRNTDKIGKDNLSVTVLESRLRLLNSYWEKFCNNHDALVRAPEFKKSEYSVTGRYDEVEGLYVLRESELRDLIAAARKAAGPGPALTSTRAPEVVLPPIVLPTFSGELLEWESFRDRFRALIHDNVHLSEMQKLQYLKGALKGDAARVVESTPIMDGCYEGAYESLERRYGNTRMLSAAHLRRLINCRPVTKAAPQEFKRLLDEFRGSRLALTAMGRPVKHWNELFVHLLSEKLDTPTRINWESSLTEPTEVPPYEDLEKYLETRVHALSLAQERDRTTTTPVVKDPKRSGPFAPRERTTLAVQHNTEATTKPRGGRSCIKCSGPHQLSHCAQFKALTAHDRKSFVNRKLLCVSCLNPGHIVNECKSTFRCMACQGHHHSLLHDAFTRRSTSPSDAFGRTPGTSTSAAAYTVRAQRVVLLATARVRVSSPCGHSVSMRALLDPGSESSFVSEKLAQTLRLKRKPVRVSLRGLDEKPLGEIRHEVKVTISSDKDASFQLQLDALVTRKVTAPTPSHPVDSASWRHLKDLPLADDDYRVPSRVDVLLGADVCGFLFLENRIGPPGAPPLVRTPFGWAPLGPVLASGTTTRPSEARTLHICRYDDLHSSLQRFWELEEVPSSVPWSPSEIQCEDHFKRTHTRDDNGRYVVRLPFASEPDDEVGATRSTATRMLLASERRHDRDLQLRDKYVAFMDEYLQMGHMEMVNTPLQRTTLGSYLPHHGVWKQTGSNAKIRVVFNASCCTLGRPSLNSYLLPGPKLQSELWIVLTRWRLHRCALSADIVKMFRQIRVHPDDCDWQRIVWRPASTAEVRDFRLTTVTYGTTSAPYLAHRVLRQLADDEGEQFPLGAEALRRNSYVDDILVGADDAEGAEEVRCQLVQLLMAGGFPLDKWAVNYETPIADRLIGEKLLQVDDAVGTLGLRWDPTADTLMVRSAQLADPTPERNWTKRQVVSETARLFDPLGWLAPVLIRAKVIIQDLWLAALEWDDLLPSAIAARWVNFRCDQALLEAVQIPRWTGSFATDELELHAFCDASERAYAAVVYLRVPHHHSDADVQLLVCKTKVSPTKQQSVPRLELCAAQLLARLLTTVRDGIQPRIARLYAWSDAAVVLAWIKGHASRWKPFVAHRVAEIHGLLPDVVWRHVSTSENPADLATRGLSYGDLKDNRLWWEGPAWLKDPPERWRESKVLLPTEVPDQRCTALLTSTIRSEPNEFLTRWSSLSRLLRVIAYIRRYVHNSRAPSIRRDGFLSRQEIEEARLLVCRLSQVDHFDEEIKRLRQGKPPLTTSSLFPLRPFLDEEGILRVGGRIAHAPLARDQRHPIVIDRRSPLASLLIRATHERTLHGGLDLTRCTLLQQYWIPRGRSLVKATLRNCLRCVRLRGITGVQQMGNLPSVRLRPARAFVRSGVDYAGPILLRLSKGRGQKTTKGYLAVFVCLCTKAVHLEAVSDLTTSAFIAAFQRFVARRGRCAQLLSDNGTTFRGANQELGRRFRAASSFYKETAEYLANDGTEWKFIPPYAPHFGGLWEAAVKSAKTHLRRSIGEHVLTFEELTTLLCRIEACLNSRPLCQLSDDPFDLEPLTPAHLMLGESLSAVPESGDLSTTSSGVSRWTLLTRIRDLFWFRWTTEYVAQLQHRPKWHKRQPNLTIGSLVLVKNELTPPTKWPMGRVTELHKGQDGLVRVVKVRMQSKETTRALAKLVVLPVDAPEH